MKLKSFILICIFGIGISFSQGKYIEKKGVLVFEASEEAFEPIKAKNESVTVILNSSNGEIASLALVKEFRFKNALMEEHFNENYIESDTHPKAIFKGKIIGFDLAQLSEKEKEFKISGNLSLHGKEKSIEFPILVKKVDNQLSINGNFTVTPQDFDISIPKIVRNKIAKQVNVSLKFNLKSK